MPRIVCSRQVYARVVDLDYGRRSRFGGIMWTVTVVLGLVALALLAGVLVGLVRFVRTARWQREHRRLLAMRPGAVTAGPSPPPLGTFVRVVRVIDGDTVRVSMFGGQDTVRVLGVDAPETKHPNLPVQLGGREAAAFAHRQLHGRRVRLVRDPCQPDRDRYGRLLRYVQLPDGSDYSVNIAAAGWARSVVYGRRPVALHSQIVQAERCAQDARLGIWR